ncbi:unnamed protein product [Parnassius apollo]|uniref:(apollo) hypothetical protein n=1 Tax=Parnassius apollo TaxID=110799 RepID=A0A8S3XGL1_PARAO|nr:unnamed protein product [Parnassius apollo]
MAASGAQERRPRRGPAPIASFDHDVSEEVSASNLQNDLACSSNAHNSVVITSLSSPQSSPETKQTFRLPEIREDPAAGGNIVANGNALAPPEQRARSHSSPAVHGNGAGLQTPAAPRIDISRASSSSHHDSRDSSPELALFAGGAEEGRARLELGFREDGALELRSSTEELAFLEGAPGEPRPAPAPSISRRHSRKDSQSSEAALLAVSGRTSRISSVGSQCSAHSAISAFSQTSRVSHLSVVSGASRSPSPHKMLLETSFCGPKPIETDPEICAAAVEERLLQIAKLTAEPLPVLVSSPSAPVSSAVAENFSVPVTSPLRPTSTPIIISTQEPVPEPVDARDHREVRTEVTVESARPVHIPRLVSPAAPTVAPCVAPSTPASCSNILDKDKRQKETKNRARAEERRARSKECREPSKPEVYKSSNRSKDIIRIKLKPDHEYDDDDDDDESERTLVGGEPARKPVTLELHERAAATSPAPQRRLRDSRTPSPSGVTVSRKSSFCSLFKSRETIASPDSPCDLLRRKKSLNEGRSRSKSRDRSTTPTSGSKIKGSMLSLFKTPRKNATSPSPSSRDGSPSVQPQRQFPQQHVEKQIGREKLKYYEDAKDGIIHIPLRTPPDEIPSTSTARAHSVVSEVRSVDREVLFATALVSPSRETTRPASAPQPRLPPERPASVTSTRSTQKPIKRTVLPDGSIIIPLHSPTEKVADSCVLTSNLPSSTVSSQTAQATDRTTPPNDKKSEDKNESSVGDVKLCTELPSSSTASNTARTIEEDNKSRRERIIFTTHVGSREQVFSTQFSITKTPSVTSEISESIPSFVESDDSRTGLRDTHITSVESPPHCERPSAPEPGDDAVRSSAGSPRTRDSSESEPSSEAGPAHSGNEVERRGLVVQESFEEELPYVPTTLPLERSLALPMVPVRERSGVRVAGVQRPRAVAPPPAPPRVPRAPPTQPAAHRFTPPAQPATPPAPVPADKLRIRLPRRTRTVSTTTPPRPERPRTRSGGDELSLASCENRKKAEWIDFEEVPERRKQPKRIQTLPATETSAEPEAEADTGGGGGGGGGGGDGGGLQYVEPEHCRCECHARRDDELPLLPDDDPSADRSGVECAGASVQLSVQLARPARRRHRSDSTGAPLPPH